MRIVFLGTPDFAVASLRRLVEAGYDIAAVVTAPDKPAGRGLQVHESAVKQYARRAGLRVLQPEKLKDPAFVEQFRALEADLGIVIAFRMLPEVIWSAPRLGTFNLHASLLPQYRGAAPINRALVDGQTETGVTTFMLNSEIDKGDILMRRRVAITTDDNAGTLHDRLMAAGAELVIESVRNIENGTVTPESQLDVPESELRPAPKIFKDDCRIDWNRPGEVIRNLVRGLSPYPAAWSTLTGGTFASGDPLQVKLFSARTEPSEHDHTPGDVITDGKSFLKIACADGYIYIEELQLAGKKRMSVAEFLRGQHNTDFIRFL